ncbi:MAG: NERD domain-containing protein [Lachnospiraceae bacterium]|nr:NERD domain-containing protein [Lachnospiraceae bacterium]
MGLFDRMREPVFLKEDSIAEKQLEQLKKLEPLLNSDGKKVINQDIKMLGYGISGEKKIIYELKNSHMPMYVLHDVYIEDGDLSAQIDFIVVTRKIVLFIECKNLIGNIKIDNKGAFIRVENNKREVGIYSPITQNQRHIELVKKIILEQSHNRLLQMIRDKLFNNFYKSVVVLANPETVLNANFAPRSIKEKVIRADQLVAYIKELYNSSKEVEESDKAMLGNAQWFLSLHKEIERDYTSKYDIYMQNGNESDAKKEETVNQNTSSQNKNIIDIQIQEVDLYNELRGYRWDKSKEENIKPYYIFNNSQLDDLINKKPRDKFELLRIAGFGEVKVNKYGDDIIRIISKY